MAAPGVTVSVGAAPAPPSTPANTGTWFVSGLAQRGPVGAPIAVASMSDYATKLGARVSYGALSDALDAYFAEGGAQAYVTRAVGPSAATATHTFADRAGSPVSTLTVTAKGPGTDGNNISVTVVNSSVSNSFQLVVSYGSTVVETSVICQTPADAVAWGRTSNYVTVADAGSGTAAPNNNPAVVSTQSLAGGTDDNGSVTDTIKVNALAVFTADLGPGQVSIPGSTTATCHEGVATHAQAFNRVGLCDAPDTATASTITALAATIQAAVTDPSYVTLCAPWVSYPPVPTGNQAIPAPRSVPPSALVAGLMARNDAVNDANVAAAGPNGISRTAVAVSQTYSATDRDALNTAGVSVIRNIPRQGGIQLYGYRSLALDPNWTSLANCRFRMQLVDDGQQIAAGFMFAQIDGQGHVLSAFNGALVANLAGYYAKGSLYGATPAEAFQVNTGSTVNTPATIAAQQIRAVESVRMSPTGELVAIQIVNFPITASLA